MTTQRFTASTAATTHRPSKSPGKTSYGGNHENSSIRSRLARPTHTSVFDGSTRRLSGTSENIEIRWCLARPVRQSARRRSRHQRRRGSHQRCDPVLSAQTDRHELVLHVHSRLAGTTAQPSRRGSNLALPG